MSRVLKSNKSLSMSQNLFKRSITATLLVAGVAISGCAAHKVDSTTTDSIPGDYRTNHPIVVSQSEQTMDLAVTPSMRRMSDLHRNKVIDIVGRFKRSGSKDIHIIVPAGSHNEAAARYVSGDIVNQMKKMGVSPSGIKVERYHASNHGDSATIRIAYGALGAHVASQCGQWDQDLTNNTENTNYTNFGCATQNNLAQMVANPADLLGPRGESEIDAGRRDNVINEWRAGDAE